MSYEAWSQKAASQASLQKVSAWLLVPKTKNKRPLTFRRSIWQIGLGRQRQLHFRALIQLLKAKSPAQK